MLVHDSIGIWCPARRLHRRKFIWPVPDNANVGLAPVQLDALVLGFPWSHIGVGGITTGVQFLIAVCIDVYGWMHD